MNKEYGPIIFIIVIVSKERLCVYINAAANGPIVHPSSDMSEYGAAVERYDEGKRKFLEK